MTRDEFEKKVEEAILGCEKRTCEYVSKEPEYRHLEEGMSISETEKRELRTLAQSLYVMSEDLKVLETCDRVVLRSQDLLSLAQAFNAWANTLSQSKADQFFIQAGLKKAN